MSRSGRHFCQLSLCLLLTVTLSGCATLVGKDGLFGGRFAKRGLRAGDTAPKFTLRSLDDDSQRVKLASFREVKPVVLFFGSYT